MKAEKNPDFRQILRDFTVSAALMIGATLLGFAFEKLGFSNSNIMMAYILCVPIIAVVTSHRGYSLVSSILAVFAFNFFFVQPKFTLNAYEQGYPITFIVLFITAFIPGTLAIRLKENALRAADAEAKAKEEKMRSDYLRSISHDLRTPLTSISGNAGNLLGNIGAFDEDTLRAIYTDIYDDSNWLISLVENLLTSARIENGSIQLKESVELADDLIAEAVNHLHPASLGREIDVRSTDEMLFVRSDSGLIVQVLTNLINNAVKYTPADSRICIGCRKEGEMAAFYVSDEGPGIPDSEKEHIFDMFYVGKQPVSDERRGLGIGLALCREIVEAHGGSISLCDNEGHGCLFSFTVPTAEVKIDG